MDYNKMGRAGGQNNHGIGGNAPKAKSKHKKRPYRIKPAHRKKESNGANEID